MNMNEYLCVCLCACKNWASEWHGYQAVIQCITFICVLTEELINIDKQGGTE